VIDGSLYHWQLEEFAVELEGNGRLSDSEMFYREALDIIFAASGDYHKDIGRIAERYASVLIRTGRRVDGSRLGYLARELESAAPAMRSTIVRNIERAYTSWCC
jgi:hypothetical protein